MDRCNGSFQTNSFYVCEKCFLNFLAETGRYTDLHKSELINYIYIALSHIEKDVRIELDSKIEDIETDFDFFEQAHILRIPEKVKSISFPNLLKTLVLMTTFEQEPGLFSLTGIMVVGGDDKKQEIVKFIHKSYLDYFSVIVLLDTKFPDYDLLLGDIDQKKMYLYIPTKQEIFSLVTKSKLEAFDILAEVLRGDQGALDKRIAPKYPATSYFLELALVEKFPDKTALVEEFHNKVLETFDQKFRVKLVSSNLDCYIRILEEGT